MPRKSIRNKKLPKRNYTRRKRGGGLFDFLYKQGPSIEHTNEFRRNFTEHLTKIIHLQDAYPSIFRDRDKAANRTELKNVVRAFKSYLNTLPSDIDKSIRIDDISPTIVGGLPMNMIARNVEDKEYRRALLDVLAAQGFAHDKQVIGIIQTNADNKRKDEKERERQIKEERERRIKEEREQAAREQAEREQAAREQAELEQAELEQQIKKSANSSTDEPTKKKKKVKPDEKVKPKQPTMLEIIEENKLRLAQEAAAKKEQERENLEKNIKALQEKKLAPKEKSKLKIVSSADIVSAYATRLREMRNAEDEYYSDTKNESSSAPQPSDNESSSAPQPSDNEPSSAPAITETTNKLPITPQLVWHEEYDILQIPRYWTSYFPNDTIYVFRDRMLSMLNNIPLLYQITTSFFPSFRLDTTNNKYINALVNDKRISDQDIPLYVRNYETLIRFVLLFIGIITNFMLQNDCYITLKGGKAIQLNCHAPYSSNDIDILIISDKVDKKEIALEMSKLLIWILSPQSIVNKMSMVEINQAEPIIKLSANTNKGYEAIVDIGFNTPKEEIKSYIVSDLTWTAQLPLPLPFPYTINRITYSHVYHLVYISQSIDAMMKEKLYYYLKYVILKNHKPEDNVDFFIPKIYRSLKALLICKYNDPAIQKQILTDMITTIIREKQSYLPGIDSVPVAEIVDGVLDKINLYRR